MTTPGIAYLKNGRSLRQIEDSVSIVKDLPRRVYNMCFDQQKGEIYLEDIMDEFHFDFKIYGMESKFIQHVMKTFESTSSNLGVMLTGIKGTGKTICAKVLANKMNLPVILVNAPYPGLVEFVANIECPCILFFDEFEKNFNTEKGHDKDLLSIMDGVFNSPYRKIFLLTTNELRVNSNFIGRPSRIKYLRSFGNLAPEVVKEFIDDTLINKEYASEIIEFVDSLTISTIDILKSIVQECNIHNVPVSAFKEFLNVERARYTFSVAYRSFYSTEMTPDKAIEEFKKQESRIGTKEKSDDGEEWEVSSGDVGIYHRKISTNTALDLMYVGMSLSPFGTVAQTLDEKGYFVLDDDGHLVVYKASNIKAKPSLYKGSLAY